MKKNRFKIFFLTIFLFSTVIAKEENLVEKQCNRIGNKLGSVSVEDCLAIKLSLTDGESLEGAPILIKEYLPLKEREPLGKVLLIGGIHGDEYSSVSIVFNVLLFSGIERYHDSSTVIREHPKGIYRPWYTLNLVICKLGGERHLCCQALDGQPGCSVIRSCCKVGL